MIKFRNALFYDTKTVILVPTRCRIVYLHKNEKKQPVNLIVCSGVSRPTHELIRSSICVNNNVWSMLSQQIWLSNIKKCDTILRTVSHIAAVELTSAANLFRPHTKSYSVWTVDMN